MIARKKRRKSPPGSGEPFVLRHTGRESVARGIATDRQLKAFRNALLLQDFFVTQETDGTETLTRNIRIMAGDWPIKVVLQRHGREASVRSYLFIPWTWIVSFGFFAMVILPFLPFEGAPIALPLALAVIAFAIYKRRFDLRTGASWQGESRTKWNGILGRLLRQHLGSGEQAPPASRLEAAASE